MINFNWVYNFREIERGRTPDPSPQPPVSAPDNRSLGLLPHGGGLVLCVNDVAQAQPRQHNSMK
jgi:hypothetical protein